MLSFDPSPTTETALECEVILRALPEWFGIEIALGARPGSRIGLKPDFKARKPVFGRRLCRV